MPRKCDWFHRLPEIRSEFEKLSVPVVDRSMFEVVFSVGRRRAIQLMHLFGGFQSGRTFLIERASLLRQLDVLESSEDVGRERRRKERLSGELEQIRRHARASRISITVTPEVYSTRFGSLPEGVELSPGRLTITFGSPEELLERLFALAQALVNDLEQFYTVAK